MIPGGPQPQLNPSMPPQPQQQQQQQQQLPTMNQQFVQQHQFQQPAMNGSAQGGAIVPSTTPGNPYALDPFAPSPVAALAAASDPFQMTPPQNPFQAPPQPQYSQQQQLVLAAPQNAASSPWALQQQQQQPAQGSNIDQLVVSTAPPSDDPFGIFSAQSVSVAAPGPAFAVPPQQVHNLHQQVQTLNLSHSNPVGDHLLSPSDSTKNNTSILPDATEEEGLALVDVELDNDSDADINTEEEEDEDAEEGQFIGNRPTQTRGRRKRNDDNTPTKKERQTPIDPLADVAPPPPPTPGRHYSEYLSKNSAPPLSSPLPKPHLVVHSGYVLSRISFRTILMRKWKQTFWIQYGPTQLLFFRTFADYEDWLNNPYHTQEAREFLVKLRVDFVSDLKKASVMGYQVTQIRRKPYGKNVMLHFKLERWMDYGPTIAAAFAARQEDMNLHNEYNNNRTKNDGNYRVDNTTNDVSSLRKIILGCMRNARDAALVATNAVGSGGRLDYSEQHHQQQQQQHQEYRGRYSSDDDEGPRGRSSAGVGSPVRANRNTSYPGGAESSARRRTAGPSDVNSGSPYHQDTDDDGGDDSSSGNNGAAVAAPPAAPLAQPIDLLG